MGTTSPAIKNEDEFTKNYDKNYIIPNKIRAALAKLKKTGWCEELDFLKLSGISNSDLVRFREPFLDDHVVVVPNDHRHPKRVWCGSKALTEKFRAKL